MGHKKERKKKGITSTLWLDCGDQNDNELKEEEVTNRSWYLKRRKWHN